MGTVFLFLVILGVLVLVHEGGHFFAAKRGGVRVHEFGFGFPPRLLAKRWGETVYSFNLLPFGGFVRLEGEDGASDPHIAGSFAGKSFSTKLSIILAGVAMNWLLAALLFGFLSASGAPRSISDAENVANASVLITAVREGSPAEEAGIKPLDRIRSLAPTTGGDALFPDRVDAVQQFVRAYAGTPIAVTVQRGEVEHTFSVVPREDPPPGEGALGVALDRVAVVSYPLVEAPWRGVFQAASYTIFLGRAFGETIATAIANREPIAGLSGPIGIAVLTGEVWEQGMTFLIGFVAILSLNLAILNAIPFPALDGGRALIALFERIRGRPISERVLARVNAAGFAILLLLLAVVTVQDFRTYLL